MDSLPPVRSAGPADLAGIASLADELATLKRIRDARSPDSLASLMFRRAWVALCAGVAVRDVALSVSAEALVALRLGGIDRAVLATSGLSADEAAEVQTASFDQVAGSILAGPGRGATAASLVDELRRRVGGEQSRPVATEQVRRVHAEDDRHVGAGQGQRGGAEQAAAAPVPAFVEALIRQPRAGATCPGKPRLILEPPEGHGDHCLAVAVLGVVLCAEYGADPAPVFLAGLAHHLHNATLPDAGFAGEVLLGTHLIPVLRRLTDQALATLPAGLAAHTRDALALAADAGTPEGRAFNAADVIDRIMEVRHFAAVAGFTEAQATDDMELVHAGPLQDFHYQVMRRAGLLLA